MKNTSKTLIFFGNERLVSGLKSTDAPVLTTLIEAGYTIAAIVSHHSEEKSRSKRPLEVAEIAKKHSIPLFLPNKPIEIIDTLKGFSADAAVLVAYGRIIPQRIIDIFPKGIINIHPSLLPQYRGPTPIESAIINGDTKTGFSIMKLTSGMDEGPVYTQKSVDLYGTETKFDLYQKLSKLSAETLIEALPSILDESLLPIAQDNNKATYCQLFTKSQSILNLSLYTAIEAERIVRAHLVFPKSKVYIKDLLVVITKSHVVANQTDMLDLPTKQDYLHIDELITPNGKKMDGDAFLRGYANQLK